jgi:hypothetical protein
VPAGDLPAPALATLMNVDAMRSAYDLSPDASELTDDRRRHMEWRRRIVSDQNG